MSAIENRYSALASTLDHGGHRARHAVAFLHVRDNTHLHIVDEQACTFWIHEFHEGVGNGYVIADLHKEKWQCLEC